MTGGSADADVIVVGGGPVGLYLAAELARHGADVVVLERRSTGHGHSRSIGIHPPALAALDGIGASAEMVCEGVPVRRGVALSGRDVLGSIAFDAALSGAFPFVLTLPQHRTEAILERRLSALAPGALRRGHRLDHVMQDGATVRAIGEHRRDGSDSGEPFALTARFLVGCDGRSSVVRESVGIAFERFSYPDSYVMGDVCDETDLGCDAAIYLTGGGVVESFPLPGGLRRWVVKTGARVAEPSAAMLAELVGGRVGVALDPRTCVMVSSFGSERAVAGRMAAGRVALAGDSAHVVPPIGGQGMNLGWLDAADLAPRLLAALGSARPAGVLAGYADSRSRAARVALRRADLNVRLGRATRWGWARDGVVRLLLARPFVGRTARMFTMHGLA